jgi:hypothetical protein
MIKELPMKTFLSLIFLALILTSCSSTYYIKHEKKIIEDLNKELENENVTIIMKNGQEIEGKQVYVSTSSIDYLDPETNEPQFVSSSTINSIIINDNSTGALEGLGVGALAGIVAGTLAEKSSEPKENKSGTMLKNVGSGISSLVLLTISSFAGLITGAIIGHSDNYIFTDPQNIKNKKAIQEREIYTVEIKSIIKKTSQYITVLWKQKTISIPWSAIMEINNKDDKSIIRVSKETYNTYFK